MYPKESYLCVYVFEWWKRSVFELLTRLDVSGCLSGLIITRKSFSYYEDAGCQTEGKRCFRDKGEREARSQSLNREAAREKERPGESVRGKKKAEAGMWWFSGQWAWEINSERERDIDRDRDRDKARDTERNDKWESSTERDRKAW